MKVTYTGREQKFTPAQERKLDGRFSKLARLLDMKQGEREAHVILTSERHRHQAEITVRFHDHRLVSIADGTDQFTAAHTAIEKLEKQVLKLRAKWRDTKRIPKAAWAEGGNAGAEETPPAEAARAEPEKRIFRVNSHTRRKPMTIDEAVLEMEKDLDYLVYRDAETDRLSVLLRRRDGHFDLVEA